MHSRSTLQRGHAEARIVRQRRQPAVHRRVTRLRERVLDEGQVRLLGGLDAKLALRDDGEIELGQQRPELAQLARIRRRENNATRHASPSTCFWAAMSSETPLRASAIMAAIWASVNGSPSAVPCTSTKPPRPVITTFMSVSQVESSA